MSKQGIVSSARPTGRFIGNLGAGTINLALDTKEVSSVYVKVFGKECSKSYTAKRASRVPFVFKG